MGELLGASDVGGNETLEHIVVSKFSIKEEWPVIINRPSS
jgi:hypothetical protein